ncbi:MAG: DNA-processing protein DprA [Oscillospiraceae bacterium]|nr:DNA-processing protein DprA [Oscillospiraceae bacterium]
MTDIYKLLFLISCIGAGRPRIWELARNFNSFDEMYDVLVSGNAGAYFTPAELAIAKRTKQEHIQAVIDYCRDRSITMLTYDDNRYPDRLRCLFNPPALIFCKGDIDVLKSGVVLSVVGARKISAYTQKAEAQLTAALAEKGVTIASGFAAGADILANLTAVRNGGKTIAVLGCGIDYSYPPENMQYVDEIAANGVIISEYFPKSSAQRLNFVSRNRILVALSSGIAIMEASEKSGSLNIAMQGVSQGKDVWVMSVHDITDSRYNGGKELLRSGALPIYGAEDIIGVYFDNKLPPEKIQTAGAFKEKKKTAAETKAEPVRAQKRTFSEFPKSMPELNEEEKTVYDILSKAAAPMSAEDISDLTGMDVFYVLTIVTDMELRGAVLSDDGQKYYLN